jgi:uncharacterized protein YecE (DUF72 family)
MKHAIKVGTSGFSFKDWKGIVYPKNLKDKDQLFYYQDELGFDCVEINSTYYTLVSARSFQGMEEKTRPGFSFVVKAFRGITHDPFDPRIKNARPTLKDAAANIDKFIYSVQPLCAAGKMGAVLLQFPVFFYPSRDHDDYLLRCREKFGDIPLVAEFRNRGWSHRKTFDFLKQHDIANCAVDEPRLPRLMPFVDAVTAHIAYLRLHGRNPNWFNVPAAERYNYLYNDKELKEFVPAVCRMSEQAATTYVFFNNCHAGMAAKNALTLKKLLGLPSYTTQQTLAF